MKTNNWLIWIIMLLLIAIITAVITMLYHNRQEIKAGTQTTAIAPDSRESMQYSGRWFRDELDLNKEQMREFLKFNPAFRQKVRSINIEMTDRKKEMLDEMSLEYSDTVRLNALSDSIGALHAELKKITYSYYLDFKRICNSEQQEKLKEVFALMFEGTIPTGNRGYGMQRGRRMRKIPLDSLN